MQWLVERRLRSSNATTRESAVAKLCASGGKGAAKAFERALSHSNPEVRRTATDGLGKVAGAANTQSLLKMLGDSDTEVVKSAVTALRKHETDQVQAALARQLRHSNLGVRAAAAHVLSTMRWQATVAEEHAFFLVARGQFGTAAAEHATLAIAPLELVIAGGPLDLSVRAIEVLGRIPGSQVVPILLRTLKAADPAVCRASIDALGGIGGKEIIKPIMEMLGHSNGHVRCIAAEVMGRLRVHESVGALIPLTRDSQWDVRKSAVDALGRIRHQKGTEALIGSLSDPDQDVREAAARALGNLRDRKGLGPLVLTLCDRETSVRRITAASLSRILEDWSFSPEAFGMVDKIKLFLKDGDQEVRRRATDLLSSLMAAQQSRASNTSENAVLAVTLFLDVIRDADCDMRLAAAEALSRLANPKAQPALEQAAKDSDPNVRAAASRGLVLLGLASPAFA